MQMSAIQLRLSGFYFFYYAIVGAFMPYWSLYLEDQGFDRATIGVLISITVFTRMFAPFIWGWLADRSGRRMLWVSIATCVECLVWFSLFVVDNTFLNLVILLFIFSFFQNAILAQFEAVTLFWLGEKRQESYGKVRQWGSIGFIVTVFALGFIFDYVHIDKLPLFLLIIGAFAWFWSWLIPEPHLAPKAQTKMQSILPILRRPKVYGFFAIQFLLLLSFAPYYSFYSNYLKDFGYSAGVTGVLWSLGVIAEIVMFAYSKHLIGRFKQTHLVVMCLVLTSLRWALIAGFPDNLVILVAAQTIHAVSFGLFHVIAMQILFEEFLPEQQGRAQAVYSTIWGFGVAIGSLIAGYGWQVWGGGTVIFYLAAVVVLLGLCCMPLLNSPLSSPSKKAV
jgi:PPP family 3-phenylpropionic acid transporter